MTVASGVARKGSFGRWKPKAWRPEYDRMVAFSILGKSNIWIAKQLGFTPEHVSTILHQDQAIELAENLQAKLRENIATNIPAVLDEIAIKAVSRVKAVIENDELFQKSPFAVVDRSLDVLKGLNHLRNKSDNGSNTTNIGVINITNEQKSDIMKGLERIREVKQLHG